jgi:hypothetical protein
MMRTLLVPGMVAVLLVGSAARAENTHFGVVDISAEGRNEKTTAELEREVVRLRQGTKPIEDPVMRRLLATGEGPAAAATRLTHEAQEQASNGDCAAAVDRAYQAETLTLASVSLDDERELLRNQYTVLVMCEDKLGHAAERDLAARHLRALVSLPPPGLPAQMWQTHVLNATDPPGTIELQIDSDPANAQIAVNFHGEGVTPHTLKVAPGPVYVEVQKDGYIKAFRKLQVSNQPARAVFRLIDRTHDRLDQALATANLLRRADPAQKPSISTLSRLAQLARADYLVLLAVKGTRAKIWFFDADKGALSTDVIESDVDPSTGKIAALAARGSPASAAKPATPTVATAPAIPAPAPATPATTPAAPSAPPAATAAPKVTGETETVSEPVSPISRRRKSSAPWWSWLIAGAIGSSLLVYIYLDRPQKQGTLAVKATWVPPN